MVRKVQDTPRAGPRTPGRRGPGRRSRPTPGGRARPGRGRTEPPTRTPGLQRDVDRPEVGRRVGDDEDQVDPLARLTVPAATTWSRKSGTTRKIRNSAESRGRRVSGRGASASRRRVGSTRSALPSHASRLSAGQPRKPPRAARARRAPQVREQVAFVRPLHLQQRGRGEPAEYREHRGDQPATRHRDRGAQQRDREQRDERGGRPTMATRGGEEREVQHAPAAAGQPFAEFGTSAGDAGALRRPA